MKPRDYQAAAVKAIWDYFAAGGKGNPIVALPTGTGKSLIIADFIANMMKYFSGQRCLMVTHVKELVDQNYNTLRRVWPHAPVGIVSAGLGKKEYGYPITYGGIGSIFRNAKALGKINLMFVDECHSVSDDDKSMMRQLINELLKINPNMKVIGLSATPYRVGMGHLTDGEIFTDVCFDATTPEWIAWFVEQGYLVPLRAKKTTAFINTDGVQIQGGDFNQTQLQRASTKEGVTEAAIDEILPLIADRRSIMAFTTGIDHVLQVDTYLSSLGLDSTYVHSKCSTAWRDTEIKRFKALEVRFMVGMGIFTTGFDHPALDCILMLRATKSPGLWVQMLGRGTRPLYCLDAYLGDDGEWHVPDLSTREGRLKAIAQSPKQDCLVFDFARNTEDIGPFDDPRLPKKKGKGGGDPIMKACGVSDMVYPEGVPIGSIGCGEYNWPAVKFCVACGAEFKFEVKIDSNTTGTAIMKGVKPDKPFEPPPIVEFPVTRISFDRHQKAGKPDSIKVSYYCGIRRFTSYQCPEHGGGATARARMWWRTHIDNNMPATIDEWVPRLGEAKQPIAIKVLMKKDYPEVREWIFEHEPADA